MALQDEVVFEYFKILLSKSKKSKTATSENPAEEVEQPPAEKSAVGNKNSAVAKAIVEEVERALFAAIQEQTETNQEDGALALPSSGLSGEGTIIPSEHISELIPVIAGAFSICATDKPKTTSKVPKKGKSKPKKKSVKCVSSDEETFEDSEEESWEREAGNEENVETKKLNSHHSTKRQVLKANKEDY